jgi:hypothetical protein
LARIATDLRALERLRSVPSADELVHVLLQFDAVHA